MPAIVERAYHAPVISFAAARRAAVAQHRDDKHVLYVINYYANTRVPRRRASAICLRDAQDERRDCHAPFRDVRAR